jgi:hypothetical protein
VKAVSLSIPAPFDVRGREQSPRIEFRRGAFAALLGAEERRDRAALLEKDRPAAAR